MNILANILWSMGHRFFVYTMDYILYEKNTEIIKMENGDLLVQEQYGK